MCFPTYALVICTYQREETLSQLIDDLCSQTALPLVFIVVDGAPDTGAVMKMLSKKTLIRTWRVLYIPSNYANLPYQRYLGWLAAKKTACDVLLFLDDDLRIRQRDAIQSVLHTFLINNEEVVGVTAEIKNGNSESEWGTTSTTSRREGTPSTWSKKLVKRWGSAKKVAPGKLTPSGHRNPVEFMGNPYEIVDWLHGGVMAFRMQTINQETFSENLFACYQLKCGKAEDTLLSHRVSARGKMVKLFDAVFHHTGDLPSNAYPTKSYHLGHAIAYSRRLLNDGYRVTEPAHLSDRLALLISYLGNIVLLWYQALVYLNHSRFNYAYGYTTGAIRGLLQPPIARKLTPEINWMHDAKLALDKIVELR